jgi:hypothetical protein
MKKDNAAKENTIDYYQLFDGTEIDTDSPDWIEQSSFEDDPEIFALLKSYYDQQQKLSPPSVVRAAILAATCLTPKILKECDCPAINITSRGGGD